MPIPPTASSRSVVLFAALGFTAWAVAAKPASPPPKLVVVIAVDGLSWPQLEGYASWFDGGLSRLLQEGQVETDCHYQHLNTETGPGHASLGTGAPPRVHAIVANRWFEAHPSGIGQLRLYCTNQPDAAKVPGNPPLFFDEVENEGRRYVFANRRTLDLWKQSGEMGAQVSQDIGGGPGGQTLVFDSDDARYLYALHHGQPLPPRPLGGTIEGPANLRADTLGDQLVARDPRSRVIALSGKDRGAIFLAGRNPAHAVYWLDRETGRYVTSSAYDTAGFTGATIHTAVRTFNRDQAGAHLVRRFGTVWAPLPPTNPPAGESPNPLAPRKQPAPRLERFQMPDLGIGFDHDLTGDRRGYFYGVYGSPMQDELLTDLALHLLGDREIALGRRGVTDLLALSFSAHDVVAHGFGSESAEALDALRRLDRELGRLLTWFDELAASPPAGGVLLALSADHGFSPLPEVVRRDEGSRTGGRLLSAEREMEHFHPDFEERLNRGLCEALCLSPGTRPVFGAEGWMVAYNRSAFPAETVFGACGAAGRVVTLADLDQIFPQVVAALFQEEIERVYLTSQRASWPADEVATAFVVNDDFPGRSGDALLLPRPHVLMHWDPTRGSGHGSHHPYDTHVPLIFWGSGIQPGMRARGFTPYDLAPTLAAALGLPLPQATGRVCAPH